MPLPLGQKDSAPVPTSLTAASRRRRSASFRASKGFGDSVLADLGRPRPGRSETFCWPTPKEPLQKSASSANHPHGSLICAPRGNLLERLMALANVINPSKPVPSILFNQSNPKRTPMCAPFPLTTTKKRPLNAQEPNRSQSRTFVGPKKPRRTLRACLAAEAPCARRRRGGP